MLMTTSLKGQEFIKSWEELRLKAYRDVAGIWTVGWGHTRNVAPGLEINMDLAESYFNADLRPGEEAIRSIINNGVLLVQHEFDALSSFCFNIGPSKFKKSTMYKYIMGRDFIAASKEFPRWNKARDPNTGEVVPVLGLSRRREAERAIFDSAIYNNN